MKNKLIKNILFVISVALNIFFLLFFILASSRGVSSFLFFDMDTPNERYTQSAFIVSVPSEDTDIDFGPVEFFLKKGSRAALQFSFRHEGLQSNLVIDPLYDHDVLRIEKSVFGLIIYALSPGEAVVQLFTPGGFRDIAYVVVYE